MKGLVGKRAVVTGGSSGIGQAIAVRLGEEGIDVAINYVGRPEGAVEKHIPMRRAGTSEEVAAMASFLCSDEAAYITGQTVFIDGGLTRTDIAAEKCR